MEDPEEPIGPISMGWSGKRTSSEKDSSVTTIQVEFSDQANCSPGEAIKEKFYITKL
jgi:hypothetical protein